MSSRDALDDAALLRYSRHVLLPEIGAEGQERWSKSTALIVGLGGLGSPVAMYLAGAGVGRLIVADGDAVDLTNLQRQVLHDTASVGTNKAESARARLHALNPAIQIDAVAERICGERLAALAAESDVVIDCSDNFDTRFAVNAACLDGRVPLVSGAAIRWEGQLSVFRNDRGGRPCYRCLYHETAPEEEACSENGVFAPVVAMIGAAQAAEALKLLLGMESTLTGKLLLLDAKTMKWRSLKLNADPDCPACGSESPGTPRTPRVGPTQAMEK